MPLLVPPARLERWFGNFAERHGAVALAVVDGALVGRAEDGSTFEARLPFEREYAGRGDAAAFTAAASRAPADWGVLLVRKGGFAVARLAGDQVTASAVGKRHVQGRTKAGGQSQQRFARRRDQQARRAWEAAADKAAALLDGAPVVVTGGDRTAVRAVFADPRLRGLTVVDPWVDVPDPRRAELEAAVATARSVRMSVVNA